MSHDGTFCAANVFKDLAARVYQRLIQVTITATIWLRFEVLAKALTLGILSIWGTMKGAARPCAIGFSPASGP
jgi:hypothetical protein